MARKMKDSGVEWIGEIPEDWEVKRTRFIADSLSKGNGITKEDVDENGDIQCIRYGEIYSKYDSSVENTESRTKLDAISTPKHIKTGDILFTCTGELVEEIGKNIVYMGDSPCLAGGDIIVMEHKEDPLFLNYALNCSSSQAQKSSGKTKLKVVHISAGEIGNVCVALPPIEEQKRLSAFISRKCASIDSIIEKTRASIEEYKKLRQAVIAQAVTKGVRGNRPMRESGIEWIGKIPNEWKVSRVGIHFDIILGKMLCTEKKGEDYSLESYYCAADVHFDGVSDNELKTMWFSPQEKELYSVETGDLLVVEGGAGAGGCAIVEKTDSPVYIQNSIMIMRPKRDSDNRYARYLIEMLVKRGYIDFVCNKATIPHFTKDKLANVPFPVSSEQQEIADYIDDRVNGIDSLIRKKEEFVDEINALKKSMIYEYVTGKKEVS